MIQFLCLIAYIMSLPWAGSTAVDIAKCESDLNQAVVGDVDLGYTGPSYGIFQINKAVWQEWLDEQGVPWYNVETDARWNAFAALLIHDEWERVFHEDGFNAWSCYDGTTE